MSEPLDNLIPEIWAEQLVTQANRALWDLFRDTTPRQPLTRRQRLRLWRQSRIYNFRMSLASRIAGFDVTETNW